MKRYGCCTLCDEEVFKAHSHWPREHPYLAGHMKRSEGTKTNAMRVTLALLDGSTTDITFCRDCLPSIPANMDKVWRKVSERHALGTDPRFREAMGHAPFADERHENALLEEARHMVHNRPLGVLAVQSWNEVPL